MAGIDKPGRKACSHTGAPEIREQEHEEPHVGSLDEGSQKHVVCHVREASRHGRDAHLPGNVVDLHPVCHRHAHEHSEDDSLYPVFRHVLIPFPVYKKRRAAGLTGLHALPALFHLYATRSNYCSTRRVHSRRNDTEAYSASGAFFLPNFAFKAPTAAGMTETRMMPTMTSSKCSCTAGMPPKK